MPMRSMPIRSMPVRFMKRPALVLALLLTSLSLAAAQDAPRDTGPRGPLPGPNANPPASAAHPDDGSNRVQPVPGAMPGSDTVPSTISEKNAADDKLITTAYTFKNLTEEQRRAIFEALKDKPAGNAFNADVGIVLPSDVDLHDMPDAVTRQVPQTSGYRYTVADNRVLLVSGASRIVVAAIPDAAAMTAGEGRHSPKPDSEARP
jgi:uncharacterized protein DUF1236